MTTITEELHIILTQVRELIKESHVVLPKKGEIKLYHHKGIDNFASVGAMFISVIQHDYCKFIVVMLKGQTYPLHYHRIKEESYFILYGDLKVQIEDETVELSKGDLVNVPRRYAHSFSTANGCVFEEVSTAYLNNDSVYDDPSIKRMVTDEKVTSLPISVLLNDEKERYNA
ncbi:MAG: cupin domain-containing protein [Lachnospiraceae bacterium]|nr:cupin domain-containing protein [Lachnospiraceae bacterium]